MFDTDDIDPRERLFLAIAFVDQPGITMDAEEIDKAIADGADRDGYTEDGKTPLTSAILGGMGSPTAVDRLLGLGADPSKRDKDGWSPWAACIMQLDNPVVADNMQKIRTMLVEAEADRSDEIFIELEVAARERDQSKVEELLKQGVDPNAPIISPLACAIDNEDISMMDLLFKYNASPDGDDVETHLMRAARDGNLEIAKYLVAAGADVNKYAWDDEEWTAEFYALQNGHKDIAKWLSEFVPEEILAERQAKVEARNPKFAQLYEMQTNGINCDLQTDDICEKLDKWDSLYAIEVTDVEQDRLLVKFASLPDDLSELVDEIDEFCPDVIEQHFGCMDDAVEMMQEHDQEIPDEMAELIAGVDFNDENFGKVLLEKSLRSSKMLALWWD